MTDHITRLKEALEAGPTPGPWVSQQEDDSDFECVGPLGPHGLVSAPVVKLHCTADADFIAAANPAAIRELLERLEQAEKDARLHRLLAPIPSGTIRMDRAGSFVPQYLHWTSGEQFNAAVDAAIASQEGGNNG